ncbi:MAG: ABC transporter substrate-binding protein [Candidatus Aminicenantes bacterium]
MRRNRLQPGLFFLVLFFLWWADQTKTIKDSLGYMHELGPAPQRIISLAPNITEILYALDLGDKIVGVTRYCDYPPPAVEKEKIGGMVDPNLEKIKALNPDLIIGFRGNPLRTLQRIRQLDLPLFVLEMGKTVESVFLIIEKIGKVTQKEKEAALLVQSMKRKHQKIQQALREVEHQPKVFFSLHGMGLWTCGQDSFLDDLVRKAKGVNIAGNIKRRWIHFNREQLIHQNPEVIIIISKSMEEFHQAKEWIKDEHVFETLEAVAEDRIYFLDENLATRPGPRIVDALADLSRIIHPQKFKKVP